MTILEVGCGNSTWLPYLARKTGAKVTGIDYSEQGCELAKKRLLNAGVDGEIICGDVFTLNKSCIGTFDLVYSLGLVEHFSELKPIVSSLVEFTNEGGILMTEVPNLRSLHGFLAYLYQPALLAKHRAVTKEQLADCYKELGITNVIAKHVGSFSLGIVAWGIEQRFPKIDFLVLPTINLLSKISEKILCTFKCYKGFSPVAPFVCVAGMKARKDWLSA